MSKKKEQAQVTQKENSSKRTALLVCCSHKFQNQKYGGRTVHNLTNQMRGNSKGWRCTCCGKVNFN